MQKFSLLSEGHIDFYGGKNSDGLLSIVSIKEGRPSEKYRELQKLPLPVGNELV